MATARFCLPLLWVVAAASAAVTPVSVAQGRGLPTPGCPPAHPHWGPRAQVPTPEASPSTLSLGTPQPAQTASPRPTPAPLGDVGTPSPPAPSPEEEPTLDVTLESKEPLDTQEPGPGPEEPRTTASGSTAGAAPGTTEDPFGSLSTSTPPCPGNEDPPEACGAPTGAQRAAVAEALGTFAVRFYRHMAETAEPGANLLFSPLNVALGLSHLLLGARGETQERLAAVLGYPPGLECVHGALQQLAAVPGLLAASQIFHHPDLSLRPRFLNESLRFYEALPRELSGNESLDLQRINAWVRQATRGRLPRLLAQLPPEPRLLLLSAVHFQGMLLPPGSHPGFALGFRGCLRGRGPAGTPRPHDALSPRSRVPAARWQTPFKAKQTVPLPFLRAGLPPVPVPTMTSKKYPVASFTDSRLQVQVGRLELSEGLSLVVLVPRGAPEALGAVERALDPPTFLALLRRAAGTPTRATAIALPRVHLDLALDVVALVHDMDYGLFLDAELCGLARGPAVAVDAAQHRAVLALDEAGVEAAGAMATSVARTALLLEALQPFLFVVWDHAGEVPLFMGRLSDPQP
ncbi:Plasma protease C1 inhibitor [Aix galericulata]|nr:Plasma protease C1 inhibitor [Aix galericulata]